jgi:predicted DNA binding CopG/RHH family protein
MPDDQIKPSAYFQTMSRMSAQPVSKLISVRLSEDLLERLAAVGNSEGLAMSDTIRLVLERGLAATPAQTSPTTKKQKKNKKGK